MTIAQKYIEECHRAKGTVKAGGALGYWIGAGVIFTCIWFTEGFILWLILSSWVGIGVTFNQIMGCLLAFYILTCKFR